MSTPTDRQVATAVAADTAIALTAGAVLALPSTLMFPTGSSGPLLVWAVLACGLHLLNAVWLAGCTGQSVGGRAAQVAEVCPRTGRPVGPSTMAQVLARGGGAMRDPRVVRISTAGAGGNVSRAR
jgi:hypothetical protein